MLTEAPSTYAEDLALFNRTYSRDERMPFQGAWPVDFWTVEATAFCEPPSGKWWGPDALCSCGREAAASFDGRYLCNVHLGEAVKSK